MGEGFLISSILLSVGSHENHTISYKIQECQQGIKPVNARLCVTPFNILSTEREGSSSDDICVSNSLILTFSYHSLLGNEFPARG
jgi:hypothetical protein